MDDIPKLISTLHADIQLQAKKKYFQVQVSTYSSKSTKLEFRYCLKNLYLNKPLEK